MRALAVVALALAFVQPAARPDPLVTRLEALLAPAFPPGEPGGVVLVARGGHTLFRRAYGMADVEQAVAMTPGAVFRIGSLTKQFTAVAILGLVQDGRLRLDDDVRPHLPALETHGRAVTVAQLLTHTSGLASMVDVERFWARARQEHDAAALLALTRDRPARFAPGTGYAYNDSGYVALGALIERLAGTSYAAFVESLVRPLGLRDTWYGDDRRIIPGRVRGYTLADGRIANARFIDMSVPHAAGALVSTADDLVRWTAALRGGRVLRRDLLARAWSAHTLPDGTSTGYGFGWHVCEVAGRPTVEHGGWINGFTASAIALRDEDLMVVALVNRDAGRPDAPFVARRVARTVLTGTPDLPAQPLTPAQRAALVGTYRGAGGAVREVVERDGTLYLARPDAAPERLVPLSATALAPEEAHGTLVLHFTPGDDGRARAMRPRVNCELGALLTRDAAPTPARPPQSSRSAAGDAGRARRAR